jgi:pSer/pThr/pTyr-binding forkhead associated (FHA) protein
MLLFTIEHAGQPTRTERIDRMPCRIGRSRDCDVQLASWRVGRVHAEVHVDGRAARIVDGGTLDTSAPPPPPAVTFPPIAPYEPPPDQDSGEAPVPSLP